VRFVPCGLSPTINAVKVHQISLNYVGVELLSKDPITLECWWCGRVWSPPHPPDGGLPRNWYRCPEQHYRTLEEARKARHVALLARAQAEFDDADQRFFSWLADRFMAAEATGKLFSMAENAKSLSPEDQDTACGRAHVRFLRARLRHSKWAAK
jgi:hypothetical protein